MKPSFTVSFNFAFTVLIEEQWKLRQQVASSPEGPQVIEADCAGLE
jgi:hypothetical protein